MSGRTKCLNCNNKIDNVGDAFCKYCEPNYFICNGCNNICLIDDNTDDILFICKKCTSGGK